MNMYQKIAPTWKSCIKIKKGLKTSRETFKPPNVDFRPVSIVDTFIFYYYIVNTLYFYGKVDIC